MVSTETSSGPRAWRAADLARDTSWIHPLSPEAIAGWRVGRINPPLGEIDRLAGPIFADHVFAADGGELAMPVFADGFAAAEAEFLLRIAATPDPDKTSYSMAEAVASARRSARRSRRPNPRPACWGCWAWAPSP